MVRLIAMLTLIAGMASNVCAQEESLSVLERWRGFDDAENALYNAIAAEADRYLQERDRLVLSLGTEKEWREYRSTVRDKLRRGFGPLPDKTPLNAAVTKTFEHEGIRVENILFESRPGFLVTAGFFRRADLAGRLPAVVYVCGHTADGYKSATYQHVILNLARKGFAVLAVDPVGQGERWQYFDPGRGKSLIGGPTSEHSYAGVQYLPIGRTMAMVRLWDCMRAVDYLVTRPDVDPGRIGVHGRSGGGTMSAFLGAMDDRIAAAAPECYITGFRRLFQSIGPQDAEQNLLGQIALGLDHGDFLVARSPKPTLVVTTTRDFFSIQGARETVRSVEPAFTTIRTGDDQRPSRGNIRIIEDDAPHQSTLKNRERVYSFFMQAFGMEGSTADEEIPPIDPLMLQVSETGQVITSGSRTVHDLILEDAEPVLAELDRSRKTGPPHAEKVARLFPEVAGIRSPDIPFDTIFTGRLHREGYAIEKYILEGGNGMPLPALLFLPEGDGRRPAIVYASDKGKEADAAPGGLIEGIVREGIAVLAMDLPGFGEIGADVHNDDSVIDGVSYNLIFGAQLIGRSVTGIQAGAVLRGTRFLSTRDDINTANITVAARGIAGPAVLHAAAADASINGAALYGSPLSWESILGERFYDAGIGSTVVPSAMLVYDLPDLMAVVAPRKFVIIDPVGGDGKPASPALAGKIRDIVTPFFGDRAYRFGIVTVGSDERAVPEFTTWMVRD